jgi:ribonuclease R
LPPKKSSRRPPPRRGSGPRKRRSSSGVPSAETSSNKPSVKKGQLPSREEVLRFVEENPHKASKRDIARAWGLKGADRIPLKAMLRDLAAEGLIERTPTKTHIPAGELPPVTVIEVKGTNDDGEVLARPTNWHGQKEPPQIFVTTKPGQIIKERDRLLARLVRAEDGTYTAKIMRRLEHSLDQILGIYQKVGRDGRILPIKRGSKREYSVRAEHAMNARSGDLVSAEPIKSRDRETRQARILETLGSIDDPRTVSLISIHDHEIPFEFPDSVILEAENVEEPNLKTRHDLTHLPFVTIDPRDAKDHDDAVFAEPDTSDKNPGGHIVFVAIADVAHFVKPGSALDREALKRGNSCYFPDRVVPMLPDHLSGDLCSLHEGVARSCMVVRMVFDRDGEKISHEFMRAGIRSLASLTYTEVQAAHEGQLSDKTGPLLKTVIEPLYSAYAAVAMAREKRGPLDLDLPEHRVEIDSDGHVTSVAFRERIEAHRVIEDFMIQANVSAAQTLAKRGMPLLYRIHEPPDQEKTSALHEFLKSVSLSAPKGGTLRPGHFNKLLGQVADGPYETMVNEIVLRSQSRAEYNDENAGHFGLNLREYAHFTSPIRRYADLIVHRGLIRALDLGDDGLTDKEMKGLPEIGQEISTHERRALGAERDATDRYVAAYMEDHIGADFDGRVSGVAKFGLFVKLNETGADGLIPIRTLDRNDYFFFDEKRMKLVGERSGAVFHLGQSVRVRVKEATPVTGGLVFEILSKGEREDKGDKKQGPRRSTRPSSPHASQKGRRKPVHKKRRK